MPKYHYRYSERRRFVGSAAVDLEGSIGNCRVFLAAAVNDWKLFPGLEFDGEASFLAHGIAKVSCVFRTKGFEKTKGPWLPREITTLPFVRSGCSPAEPD